MLKRPRQPKIAWRVDRGRMLLSRSLEKDEANANVIAEQYEFSRVSDMARSNFVRVAWMVAWPGPGIDPIYMYGRFASASIHRPGSLEAPDAVAS